MILELADSTVLVDGKSLVINPRINIADNNQYRIKFNVVAEKEDIPFDIVIYKLTPKLDKLALKLNVTGEERETQTKISLSIIFDILHRELKVKGSVGHISVNEKMKHVAEIVSLITNLVTQCKK